MSRTDFTPADPQSRELLLSAAKKLFAEKGLDGVSVREIAGAAKVNPSLVSYHFGGKEGLYRSCLEQFGQGRLQVVRKLLQPARSEAEFRLRLEMFIETLFEGFIQEPHLERMIQRECEQELPVVEDIFRETFLKIFGALHDFYKGAHEAGILKKEINPQIAAGIIHGTLMHMAKMDPLIKRYFGLSIHDPKHRQRLKEQMMLVAMDGMIAEEGKKK